MKDEILLITWGTGSFGSSVLKRFLIGDVHDQASVDSVVSGVNYIFHAATLKQVPS